jgi:L-ascorbate metabolism protein UlaG (beta-lactamase superfamily)
MAFIKMAPQFGAAPSGIHLENISKSVNYGESGFINQIPTSMDMGFRGGMQTMYEWIFLDGERSPSEPLPVKFGEKSPGCQSLSRITWYGHSAVLLEMEGKMILIDPMLGNAAAPVSFMTKRFAYEQPIDLESIPAIDAVVLSHDHYDHLDYESIIKLKTKVGHFYTPLGVGGHLKRWGISELKITELDWWESAEVGKLTFVAAPARHFSGRGLSDRNKTQWASWIIMGSSEKIYFSGDSGYGPHFKEIGEKYGPFDFAMMECGQYNEKWKAIHMMPEQTVQASIDLQAKKMMPIHWSAFNLSLHSWTDPVERASAAAKLHNVDMVTPMIGQTFCPGDFHNSNSWWKSM